MICMQEERLIALRSVPELLHQRGSRRVHVSTVYRWAQRGIQGVALEVVRVGGLAYTSERAIQRFIERLGALDGTTTSREAAVGSSGR